MTTETTEQIQVTTNSTGGTKMFLLGLAAGAGLFFMIGFFVLLFMVLSGTSANYDVAYVADSHEDQAPTEVPDQNVTDADWYYGDKDAPITVVEYSDVECPFCTRFHDTMKQVVDDNPDVKWVFRHFPLTSIHPNAQRAAEAAECAGSLGGNDAFWAFTDQLFMNQGNLNDATYERLAGVAGVDAARLMSCLNDGTFAQKVESQFNQALATGGRGTPHSIIVGNDGTQVVASGALPQAQVEAMINQIR